MLVRVLLIGMMAGVATVAIAQPPAPVIQVRVDTRVELMSIIFRLAGNPEYNQPNSKSPYADEVERRFGVLRNHPAVRMARQLRADRGISYDAVMSLAVHVTDVPALGERMPFEPRPPRLDSRWTASDARRFLEQARRFVEDSDFVGFVKDHETLYARSAERLERKLNERAYLDWFDSFFGKRPHAQFAAIVGMLNGGGNYGVGVRFPDGREEITPVMGVYQFDAEGVPIVSDGIVPTVVHEFCHTYTNELVDRFADQLEPAARKLWPASEQAMRRQAYGNWKTMMYESMVRACVIRYLDKHDGPAAAKREVELNVSRGFVWIDGLSECLSDYERHRDQYPDFAAFMPRVVAFFDDYATHEAASGPPGPRVVSTNPANGQSDVGPAVATLTITFDRRMKDQSWSICGDPSQIPKATGAPSYDRTRTVLTVPIRLEPGRNYRFSLNSGRFHGFKSEKGEILVPVMITFRTAPR